MRRLKFFEIFCCKRVTKSQKVRFRINKKTKIYHPVDLAVPADHRVKMKEIEKIDKYLVFTRQLKKKRNMKVTTIPTVVGTKDLEKDLPNWTNRDHTDHSTVKIGWNTQKSLRDLRRLVIQTSVKDQQLTLVWKFAWIIIIIIITTVIPIEIGTLGTVTKGLVKRPEDLLIRGQVETIQTKVLLRLARILRRLLETWGDLLSFKFQLKIIS